MYKVFDFKCDQCGHTEDDVMIKHDNYPDCSKCNSKMTKLVASVGLLRTNFHDKPKVRDRSK